MAAKKAVQKFKDDQAQGATRGFLEDLFDDYYAQRFKVYKMNFVRGIVFGFGSVIGGTLMVALLLWLLSFTNELPFIGHFTQTIQHSIETAKPR
jgi:uncharacterized membrane protein YfcA